MTPKTQATKDKNKYTGLHQIKTFVLHRLSGETGEARSENE